MKKIVTVVVALLIGFSYNVYAEAVEVIPPQKKVLGTNNGRFVFGQISNMRRDQYMLDTQTGRLWQIVQSKEKSIILQIVPYNHVDGSISVVPEDIQNAIVQNLMKQSAKQKKTAKTK